MKIRFVPPHAPALPGPGGWGNPPNLGTGFTQAYQTYDGSVLPPYAFGASINQYGMIAAAQGQVKGLSIAAEPLNPTGSGLMLRTKFPASSDPFWNEAWPYSDGGGRAPSARYNMASGLVSRNWTELHVRWCCRWNAGWTQSGPVPLAPTQYGIGFGCSASTQNTITALNTPAWIVNEHIGRYFTQTLSNSSYYRILGNTANVLQIPNDQQFGLGFNNQVRSSAISTLSAGISAGVTVIPVASVSGFLLSQPTIIIGEGAFREQRTITTITAAPPSLTVSVATSFAHTLGDSVARVGGYIVSGNPGAVGNNAGTKFWFPQLEVSASGSGVVHGTAWSRNQIYTGQDNNFFGGWQRNAAAPAGGYPHPYHAPQMQDWDGVTTDGQGAIGTNGAITIGLVSHFASPPSSDFANIPTGNIFDIEFYLKIGTPGLADGIVRVWVNGSSTPIYDRSDIYFAPAYAKDSVSVAGTNWTIGVPITAVRFRNVFMDMTFGGGAFTPATTQYFDILGFQCFGK